MQKLAEGVKKFSNDKGVNKSINFNYFVGYLRVDPEKYKMNERKLNALENIYQRIKEKKQITPNQKSILRDEEEIRKQKEVYDKYGRNRWLAKDIFKNVADMDISTSVIIDGMPIEIEPGSLQISDDSSIVTFQLSKMRSDLLPAKKKIEQQKKDIRLADDEYIGEFTSVLYDENQSVFMVQSNMYGLTHSQVEEYLTLLRRRVIEETDSDDIKELSCELSVIINNCDIANIKRSEEVKKVRFRAADGIYDALAAEDNMFARVRRSIGDRSGYVIDITVSIDKDAEIKTMDKEFMEDIAGNFDKIQDSKYDPNLLVEVTRKETKDSGTELINLLRPRMTECITVKMKPRTSVAHEFLSAKMKEAYDKTKVKIYNILGD